MRSASLLASAALALVCGAARAQDAADLARRLGPAARWDAGSGTMEFRSDVSLSFGRAMARDSIWEVPAAVRRIVIGEGVRVTGAFTTHSSLDVEGRGPSSEIYGTPQAGLLQGLGLGHDGLTMPYSAIFAEGSGITVNVRNLTSRDPMGPHFTGYGAVFHLEDVRAIDDRGGFSNHSDGLAAAAGSTVNRCFFSTGDDVIKVYKDITVTDTTIEMIMNAVPIQFGWSGYGDGARGTFQNVRITGSLGRRDDRPVIEAYGGAYKKELVIDGLTVDNPTASLFNFRDAGANIYVKIDRADIRVKRYANELKAAHVLLVCDSSEPKASFSCGR